MAWLLRLAAGTCAAVAHVTVWAVTLERIIVTRKDTGMPGRRRAVRE